MRFLSVILLVGFVLLGVSPASAFLAGAPSLEPNRYILSVEFQTTDLDLERKGNGNDHWNLDASHFLVRGAYGLTQESELFIVAGLNNTNFKDEQDVATLGGSMNGQNEVSYGIGFRGRLYKSRRYDVIGSLQVLSSPNINGIFSRNDGTLFNTGFDLLETQASVAVVYPLGDFRPYLGVQYDDYSINVGGLQGVEELNAEKEFGILLGGSYRFDRTWSLDAEAQLMNGKNFGMAVKYIF